jgi:hypothetical protein
VDKGTGKRRSGAEGLRGQGTGGRREWMEGHAYSVCMKEWKLNAKSGEQRNEGPGARPSRRTLGDIPVVIRVGERLGDIALIEERWGLKESQPPT